MAWCRDRDRLDDLLGPRETWPVSGLDAALAVASLASGAWAGQSRRQLADDGAWLADRLRRRNLDVVEDGVGVHYRCVVTTEPDAVADRFAAEGIGVRPLGRAHGVEPGAVRILAPRWDERRTFSSALDAATSAAAELQPCG